MEMASAVEDLFSVTYQCHTFTVTGTNERKVGLLKNVTEYNDVVREINKFCHTYIAEEYRPDLVSKLDTTDFLYLLDIAERTIMVEVIGEKNDNPNFHLSAAIFNHKKGAMYRALRSCAKAVDMGDNFGYLLACFLYPDYECITNVAKLAWNAGYVQSPTINFILHQNADSDEMRKRHAAIFNLLF